MTIKIQDKDYTLKYNNKSLFKIEKLIDRPIYEVFEDENELKKMKTVFAFVWGGIQEGISFDEFSDITNFKEIGDILPDIMSLINDSFSTGTKKK